MSHAHTTFSLISRLSAALDHPLIKRRNLGFALNQPFSWSLINAADTFARLPVEDRDGERGDQLRLKMATLRHFNRLASLENNITAHQIAQCLRLDTEINLDQIKQAAADRVKMERRSGKLAPANVKVRFVQLYTSMHEEAMAKHRLQKAVANEVYFLCNRSDEFLTTENHATPDAELADFDQYDYMVDALLDRMTMPCIRGMEEIQMVLDKSYRIEAVAQASQLQTELTKIGAELGISWDKLKIETAKIDAELEAALKDEAGLEAEIDAELDAMGDLSTLVTPETPPAPVRRTVKSDARLAREAEDVRVGAVAQALNAAEAKKAATKAKAAATRAANKAAKATALTT